MIIILMLTMPIVIGTIIGTFVMDFLFMNDPVVGWTNKESSKSWKFIRIGALIYIVLIVAGVILSNL